MAYQHGSNIEAGRTSGRLEHRGRKRARPLNPFSGLRTLSVPLRAASAYVPRCHAAVLAGWVPERLTKCTFYSPYWQIDLNRSLAKPDRHTVVARVLVLRIVLRVLKAR